MSISDVEHVVAACAADRDDVMAARVLGSAARGTATAGSFALVETCLRELRALARPDVLDHDIKEARFG